MFNVHEIKHTYKDLYVHYNFLTILFIIKFSSIIYKVYEKHGTFISTITFDWLIYFEI